MRVMYEWEDRISGDKDIKAIGMVDEALSAATEL